MTELKQITTCPRCNSIECWHEYGDIYKCFHCHLEVVKGKKVMEVFPLQEFSKIVKKGEGGIEI